jgi:hypothetical protein
LKIGVWAGLNFELKGFIIYAEIIESKEYKNGENTTRENN